jgi:DNA-directed RNA polymerase subunit H (RpoH/RPB5)
MNVFWLDEDSELAARYHCDRHVVNQLKEYAQILSTAAHIGGFHEPWMYEPIPDMNRQLHEWVAESRSNYLRLLMLSKNLYEEYEIRYGVGHKSYDRVIKNIDLTDVDLPEIGHSDPPLSVRSDLEKDDVVESYRDFYNYGKTWNMRWTNRTVPDWYHTEVDSYHD